MNMVECIKKEYVTQSMGGLEDFVGCMIKRDLTKMTHNISQLDLINKTTQEFNGHLK